jgi:hypothetical protein
MSETTSKSGPGESQYISHSSHLVIVTCRTEN